MLVQAINDPPTLNPITSPAAINEDSGEQTINLTGISAGACESQTLRVTATSSNTTLLPTIGEDYTSPSSTGTLSYTPAADQSGSALVTVTVTDAGPDGVLDTFDDGIVTQQFTVLVQAINDPPTLNPITSPAAINEDSGEQTINLAGISAGACESQTLRVTATSSNTTLLPTIGEDYTSPSSTGTLSYTPAADQSGSALVTVTVTDAGVDGVLDTSDDGIVTQQFTVLVNPIDDAPVATDQNVTINEDTETTITLSSTDVDGPASTYSIVRQPTHGTLAPNNGSGYTYTPDENFNGSDSFTFTANDGTSGSNVATVTITINPVNDAPSFTVGPYQEVVQGAVPQTVAGWAKDILVGPEDESQQGANFIIVSISNTALFATEGQPAISSDGTLTYQPAANASGTAIVTVQIHDDGGTAHGGQDTSLEQTFTIYVDPGSRSLHWVGGHHQDNNPNAPCPWSIALNWQEDEVPGINDQLFFDASAVTTTSINDLSPGTRFHSITFAASGFHLTGSSIALTDSIVVNPYVLDSQLNLDVVLDGAV